MTELERFEQFVDWFYELVWGTPRRPEVKFEGMMARDKGYTEEHTKEWMEYAKKPKRARTKKGKYKADNKKTKDVNEAWVGGNAPKKKNKKI